MTMTLADLARPEGVQHLVDVTGGTHSYYNHPERAHEVLAVAQSAIERNPNIGQTKVRIMPNLPNSFYNFDRGELILGVTNPHALAHELEHADSLRQASLYQKLLRVSQGVSRLNNVMALPTMLALRTFLTDKDRRNDILKTLSAVSTAVAAPELMEEASASIKAIQHSPNRREAMKTLLPAFMAHLTTRLQPALVYQAGRVP